MDASTERPVSGPAPDVTEAVGAVQEKHRQAEARCQAEFKRVSGRYSLSLTDAQECVFAFDDLLHLDRHNGGVQRFAALGAKAGRYLLDQLKSPPPAHTEARPLFITTALCLCLSSEVEADLGKILTEAGDHLFVRQYAIVALTAGKEPASKKLLLDFFVQYMAREQHQREPATFRALVLAMEAVKDPGAVPGLTQVIAQERRSSSVELVDVAIRALGDIGDARAVPALRKLVKTKSRWMSAPQACLTLAKLKDEKAGKLIREVHYKRSLWTAWQLALFEEAEKICLIPARGKSKAKADAEAKAKAEAKAEAKAQAAAGDKTGQGTKDKDDTDA